MSHLNESPTTQICDTRKRHHWNWIKITNVENVSTAFLKTEVTIETIIF